MTLVAKNWLIEPEVILTVFAILVQDVSESTNLLHYNKEQYLATLLPGILHAGAICSLTIAMQNERPGFVALIGYMGIVYAFVGDAFIYSKTLYGHDLLGISILLTLNVTLVFRRLSQLAWSPVMKIERDARSRNNPITHLHTTYWITYWRLYS